MRAKVKVKTYKTEGLGYGICFIKEFCVVAKIPPTIPLNCR